MVPGKIIDRYFGEAGFAEPMTSAWAYYEKHARLEASRPDMWGGQTPTDTAVQQLANAFITEWNWAVETLLRHWESPPTTTTTGL